MLGRGDVGEGDVVDCGCRMFDRGILGGEMLRRGDVEEGGCWGYWVWGFWGGGMFGRGVGGVCDGGSEYFIYIFFL